MAEQVIDRDEVVALLFDVSDIVVTLDELAEKAQARLEGERAQN